MTSLQNELINVGVPVGTAVAFAATPGTVLITGSYGGFVADGEGRILYAFDDEGRARVAPEYADHASFDLAEWRAWALSISPTYADSPYLDITEANVILTDGSVLPASADFRDTQQELHP